MADRLLFPPTTVADMRQRGWDAPDFVYVSGDAYVDHPSFGAAVIVRTLEAAGYHVAVLAQPNWKNANDFKRFGRPNYGFLVSSGVIDSMVNHYTAAKRRRSSDVYTPGGKAAKRPDRAVNVYCRLIREAYGDIPIAIGGVEASLRRFAHYDYWDDAVRPSILVDSGADLLMFGMGERTILVTADWMSRGAPVWECAKMRGVCFLSPAAMRASVEIPSYEDCVRSKKKYGEAFLVQYNKGYIHDVGGPTANFRRAACDKQLKVGTCAGRQCLFPKPCPNMVVDHTDYIKLLREVRALPKVKKVFVRSGLRYDYIMADKSDAFLRELCQYHVSGQLKVAPEHVSPKVLAVMGKPGRDVYDAFCEKYKRINQELGKEQYLVPYLISSHPGSDLSAAIELAEYLRDINHQPEQVQDFYPTPGSAIISWRIIQRLTSARGARRHGQAGSCLRCVL